MNHFTDHHWVLPSGSLLVGTPNGFETERFSNGTLSFETVNHGSTQVILLHFALGLRQTYVISC